MVTLVVVRSLNDDENDDLDDHDDDHLGGGALPQALLAHAKVCNLDVALLHNIQLQDGCTDNFLEKTDGNSAHEHHDDDCGEQCLVKHDVVQFQVSVNNSMLARKLILFEIFLDFFNKFYFEYT